MSRPRALAYLAIFAIWTAVVVQCFAQDLLLGRPRDFLYLSATYSLWKSHPPGSHGFLMFLSAEDFSLGNAYISRSHPFLFVHFLLFEAARLLGWSEPIRENFLVVIYLALWLAACMLVMRSASADGEESPSDRGHSVLLYDCLLIGIFATVPSIWLGLAVHRDNCFLLASFCFVVLGAWQTQQPGAERRKLLLLVLAVLLAPMLTPLGVLLYYWICVRDSRRNGPAPASIGPAMIGVAGCAAFFSPRIAVAMLGLEIRGSPYSFRSGLDGDSRYFDTIAGALLAPEPAFRLWNMHPAFLAVVAVLCAAHLGHRRWIAHRIWTQLAIGISPYLFFLLFFPQLVAVHPYVFDSLAQAACVACLPWYTNGAMPRRPEGHLSLLFLLSFVLMSQLLDLARGGNLERSARSESSAPLDEGLNRAYDTPAT